MIMSKIGMRDVLCTTHFDQKFSSVIVSTLFFLYMIFVNYHIFARKHLLNFLGHQTFNLLYGYIVLQQIMFQIAKNNLLKFNFWCLCVSHKCNFNLWIFVKVITRYTYIFHRIIISLRIVLIFNTFLIW